MNTTELKALAEALTFHGRYGYETEDVASKRRIHRNADASAAILELIASHEDAQGEIRALRATEQNLRERVKALEDGVRRATDALDLLTEKVDGTGFSESDEFSNALDEIDLGRALLEQKP